MVKSKGVGEAEGLPRLPKECPAGRWVRVPWALLRAEPPAVLGTLLVTLPVCPEPPACYRGILLGIAGTVVSIPRLEIQGRRKGSAVAHTYQTCRDGGCRLVLTSTRSKRALWSFPAPFLCKKGKKGDSASLHAQLGW